MLSGHAFFVAGTPDALGDVLALLQQEGIGTQNNPDLHVRTYASFGIDDARALTERASMRALGSDSASSRPHEARRVFVLAVNAIAREAQNALLKTLEEPPAGALFFFIHPAPQTLLPTIRSRVQILEFPSATATRSLVDVDAFLKATREKRLDMLKPLLEKGDDEKRDIGAAMTFLASLESALEKDGAQGERIAVLYRARGYIGDRGALVKSLLEHVALLV